MLYVFGSIKVVSCTHRRDLLFCRDWVLLWDAALLIKNHTPDEEIRLREPGQRRNFAMYLLFYKQILNPLVILPHIPTKRETIKTHLRNLVMAQAAPGPAPGLLETTTLPDLNSLPLFQYSDDGYNYQDIPPEEDNGPRKIINYVFSQDKWVGQPNVQELDPVLDTYTLNGADISVQAILSQNLEDRPCEICLEQEGHCRGEECRTSLREHFDEVEADYIRIGTAPGMGYGVFATGEIPTKTIVGEYLGEV